jgi:hypothetical protein
MTYAPVGGSWKIFGGCRTVHLGSERRAPPIHLFQSHGVGGPGSLRARCERFKLDASPERWRGLRDRMHATTCKCGFDTSRQTFTQSFGNSDLDASLLLLL